MILLVVSDLHLGKGRFLGNGQVNIMEDFEHDDLFKEFLDYYSMGEYLDREVHLILNGDIFNLLQIDIEGVFSRYITEDMTIVALQKIIKGHEVFFSALKRFANTPKKKISYIIGNHDSGMRWKRVQLEFNRAVEQDINFSFNLKIGGVYIEHGHRFEAINIVPYKDYYTLGPNGEEILNLPWGSLFCVDILPQLKKHRPYMDKVRPLGLYVRWCLFHDFSFFRHMSKIVISFIFKTLWQDWRRKERNAHSTIKLLKQITIYPRYEKQAKRILNKFHEIHTVIMGHTHVREWRRFPEEKFYFNSGTWTKIPSMNYALHEDEKVLNYICIEFDPEGKQVVKMGMNAWQGQWRPFKEDIGVSSLT